MIGVAGEPLRLAYGDLLLFGKEAPLTVNMDSAFVVP
jgi:hypothetical protein